MDINVFRGLVTGILLALFLWLVVWAWSKSRKEAFDAAAQLPLEDETPPDSHREGAR
jgi:cytochrome c oxidase cbb3-type subunit IV